QGGTGDVLGHVLPWRHAAELDHVEQMADVAVAEHAVLVVDSALRAGGLEAMVVADDPAREEAPVAAAPHDEPRRIDPGVAGEAEVESGHDVGEVAAAPVADHGAR